MTTFAICLALTVMGEGCYEANASHYAPGVMLPTVELRQEWGELPADLTPYDGFVAVVDCGLIGHTLYAKPNNGGWETLLVTDCSGHVSTTVWMTENNIFGEVDYETAVRWGVVGGGDPVLVGR